SLTVQSHGESTILNKKGAWLDSTKVTRYLTKTETWMIRNPGYVLVAAVIGWMLGSNRSQKIIFVVLLLLVAPAYS
nr:membrane glycoprotein M [Cacipacore virus]